MAQLSSESLEASIIRAVQQEADRLREKAITDSVSAYETQLREAVLRSAVKITSFYDLTRDGHNIVLTVRHSDR